MWVKLMRLIGLVAVVGICFGTVAACGGQASYLAAEAPIDADRLQKLNELNETSEDMYQQTIKGNIAAARQQIFAISNMITRMSFAGITSIEGMNALTNSVLEAQRVLNAVQVQPDQVSLAAAKVRLATDALTHKSAPLWHEYYDLLIGDLQGVWSSVKDGRRKDADIAFDKLTSHLNIVKPAIVISKPPEQIERVQSLMAYVKSQLRLKPHDADQIERGLRILRETLDRLFDKKHQSAFLPFIDPDNPVLWTLGIGISIMSALAYSAWRMYKGQDDIVPVRQRIGK